LRLCGVLFNNCDPYRVTNPNTNPKPNGNPNPNPTLDVYNMGPHILVHASYKIEIWCNYETSKSLQKCERKYFPYCKRAVRLAICKSLQGLEDDPARGVAGNAQHDSQGCFQM